jgi:hypothetical protein
MELGHCTKPLDPDEGQRYTEPIKEEDHTYELENIYKLIDYGNMITLIL